MSELVIAQRQLKRAKLRHEAALISLRVYRGCECEVDFKDPSKPVHSSCTYRGVPYVS